MSFLFPLAGVYSNYLLKINLSKGDRRGADASCFLPLLIQAGNIQKTVTLKINLCGLS